MNKSDACPEIHQRATGILKAFYGESAAFRDGQYEAIEATMTRKRTLVVQRTGWGKSLVYLYAQSSYGKRTAVLQWLSARCSF